MTHLRRAVAVVLLAAFAWLLASPAVGNWLLDRVRPRFEYDLAFEDDGNYTRNVWHRRQVYRDGRRGPTVFDRFDSWRLDG